MHIYFKNLFCEIGNDTELLVELTEDFQTIFQDSIQDLLHAIEITDYYKIDRIAHKLKGASMNFTIPEFTNAAKIIEFIGKDKLEDDTTEALTILKEEFIKFKNESDILKTENPA
jgi:HPt (histidine-containing phosphotransfer) domain-containing protein